MIWHRVAPDEPVAHERGDGSCCCLADAARFTDRSAIVRLGCLDCGCPPQAAPVAPATAA